MAYLLSLLPLLACPLMMGLMMWLMMRGNKNQTAQNADQTRVGANSAPSETGKMRTMGGFHLCLDRKVVTGLAVVGVGVWIVAPNLVWAALPVLILLACPLSMLLMMRGMGGGQRAVQSAQERQLPQARSIPEEQLDALRTQHGAIVREIADLEAANGTVRQEDRAVAYASYERGQRHS